MYVSILPTERTVTYNGPMNDSMVIGKIPGRIWWNGGGHIWVDWNMTGGTRGNLLILTIGSEQISSSNPAFGFGGWDANGSASRVSLPRDQTLDIMLGREWGGSGNVSARIHWRLDGWNPQLLIPGIVAVIAGIPVAAMGRKKRETSMSLAEFENEVKL